MEIFLLNLKYNILPGFKIELNVNIMLCDCTSSFYCRDTFRSIDITHYSLPFPPLSN